jgi:hypothetical protein
VKSTDDACPFCGAPAPEERAAPVARSLRVSRAALLAVSATAILGAAGCSADSPPTDDAGVDGASSNPSDATSDVPSAQPHYGAVIPDAADDVTIVALYGAPVTGH